ncbi:DUF305 domain-containing protein [Nesterenkonia natronophila]|uniref:DUF305 domain-containing protein n=1 Tax=Nesterenkonia natronophila TaxID=2174932 RepID=UPI00131443AB|nr:DUF305 domain-containing protein [Nesterenkonia natronophila]
MAALAEDIREAHHSEIDHMEKWMERWGHEPDEHGSHGDPSHGHHGMRSHEELEDLESAHGHGASRLYLEQMIDHHEGAVSMAEEHLREGEHSGVHELSEDVIADQRAEVEHMEEMLGDF